MYEIRLSRYNKIRRNLYLLIFSLFFCLSITAVWPSLLYAQQVPINDIYQDYLRTLQINGTLLQSDESSTHYLKTDSLITVPDHLGPHPWDNLPPEVLKHNDLSDSPIIVPHDPILRTYWQSLEPGGNQDGPVWQGRGFTNDLSTGFFASYGIFSASIRPHVIFTQNKSFTLSPYSTNPNRSEYSYPLGNIDWPQRFGNSAYWSLYPGNSYIRADYSGWTTGISNELMRWGPARKNALLLDSNAPGFRHFFIGTSKPKDIYIGQLQTKLFWGRLKESDYFDENPSNNKRYITGITLSISPEPAPGLKFGINRIFYETIPPEGIPVGNLFKVFEAFTKINFANDSNAGGNDQSDQLLSLFGQWRFPESGLEIYGEWARTDHSWNWRDFFTEPEHSRGYTLGLEKTISLSNNRILSINGELTQLESSKTGEFRPDPTFYVHGTAIQGYTNRGQLLGASIGPGSSSQYIDGTLYFDKGRFKVFGQRVAQNNDFLYQSDAMLNSNIQSPDNPKYWLHNIEFRFGASYVYFYKQIEAEIGFTYRRELNDHYIYKNDKNHLGIALALRYRLSQLR